MSTILKLSTNSLRRVAKSPFFCLGILFIVLFGLTYNNSSIDKEEFPLTQVGNQCSLFAASMDNLELESPDLSLIQNSSVVGNSPPLIISSKVLGSLVGSEIIVEEKRKEITGYIIQPGDSLWSIADHFGISLDTIRWANDLNKSSVLKVGNKLIIPPVSGALHLVESGDTLSGIANDYKGKVEEIIAYSDIDEDGKIFVGDILVIPGGKMPVAAQSSYTQVPLADSYLSFPTQGTISQGLHWYNAIDIANKCGTPIYAAAKGTVQKTGYIKIGGNRVRIIHSNGIVTYYGHLSRISVSPGQVVSQGQLIGYMGNTGYTIGATGCHLHFDILNKGVINPLLKYPVGTYISWK
ncbi:peptidoglycan DD-metalloendopeptidase family protein [Candidatus Parcubacteria bacterium]|nr:peptidoglycan DD-metalloendopeptidase family protein [Candidatus Parcubacteria bacterium]